MICIALKTICQIEITEAIFGHVSLANKKVSKYHILILNCTSIYLPFSALVFFSNVLLEKSLTAFFFKIKANKFDIVSLHSKKKHLDTLVNKMPNQEIFGPVCQPQSV